MRERFREWYPPTVPELTGAWDTGLVVLDAAAMLGLYRTDTASANLVFDLLNWLGDRLWVPHQAALEFHRNRADVVRKQLGAYDEVRRALQKIPDQLKQIVSRHPVLNSSMFIQELAIKTSELTKIVDDLEVRHALPQSKSIDGDDLARRLNDAIGEKVGQPLGITDEMIKAANERMDRKIPPGYEDKAKAHNGVTGDLIIWWEILEHIRTHGQGKAILFVTEDLKQDWWRIEEGERQGPQPALAQEAISAGASFFWMQSLVSFVRSGGVHLGWEARDMQLVELSQTESSPAPHADTEGAP